MAYTRVDPARFEIKRRLKPMIQGGLSSTVVIEGEMYINVSFSGALVLRAGKILPRGIGKYDSAFMSLDFDIMKNQYILYVQYVDSGRWPQRYPLLVYNERPEWLNKVKRIGYYTKQLKENVCQPA